MSIQSMNVLAFYEGKILSCSHGLDLNPDTDPYPDGTIIKHTDTNSWFQKGVNGSPYTWTRITQDQVPKEYLLLDMML